MRPARHGRARGMILGWTWSVLTSATGGCFVAVVLVELVWYWSSHSLDQSTESSSAESRRAYQGRATPSSRRLPVHGVSDPLQVPDHRRRHPRRFDRLSPGAGAEGARQGRWARHPGDRQDRHRGRRQRRRLRRGAQQLLPAGHARADGGMRRGVGKRSEGLQLSPGRLHADQPRGHARRLRRDLSAAEGDRLRVGVHRRRSR